MNIDDFLEDAKQLAEEAETGRKIAEAAKGGRVQSASYEFKMDANEAHRIREYAYRVIASVWNDKRRDATLKEIFEGVKDKILADIESGEWPKVWSIPSKRTVDRRVNELAEMNSTYWVFDFTVPPCVCIRAGHYRPNPYLLDEETRKAIGEIAKA